MWATPARVSLCTVTHVLRPAILTLTADYRLMSEFAMSYGQLGPAIAAPDDIDGQLRANGQMNDCGADEF